MAQQHFEAINPTRSWAAWALIAVCQGGGAALVLASCRELSNDMSECGSDPSYVGIDHPEPEGFYLWEGTGLYDGLDGVDYTGDCRKLELSELQGWLDKHEGPGCEEDPEKPPIELFLQELAPMPDDTL